MDEVQKANISCCSVFCVSFRVALHLRQCLSVFFHFSSFNSATSKTLLEKAEWIKGQERWTGGVQSLRPPLFPNVVKDCLDFSVLSYWREQAFALSYIFRTNQCHCLMLVLCHFPVFYVACLFSVDELLDETLTEHNLSPATEEGSELSQHLCESVFAKPELACENEEMILKICHRLCTAVERLLELVTESTKQVKLVYWYRCRITLKMKSLVRLVYLVPGSIWNSSSCQVFCATHRKVLVWNAYSWC